MSARFPALAAAGRDLIALLLNHYTSWHAVTIPIEGNEVLDCAELASRRVLVAIIALSKVGALAYEAPPAFDRPSHARHGDSRSVQPSFHGGVPP
jgi:hypothetical protein